MKPVPDEPSKVKIKCPEIEVLDSYEKIQVPSFGAYFRRENFPRKYILILTLVVSRNCFMKEAPYSQQLKD